ncbi:hypothetical protein C8R41DRAFT_96800 [Lentinula lateritia]|uniref:Uncharacterized protein n=1 Tax=Lentinula lateritia TaxID=40482 RepID=A0ABQ8UY61_9AGAR|nr:hypothetical protein C8R41DRAFT_96800 [Lentinula lateritia]
MYILLKYQVLLLISTTTIFNRLLFFLVPKLPQTPSDSLIRVSSYDATVIYLSCYLSCSIAPSYCIISPSICAHLDIFSRNVTCHVSIGATKGEAVLLHTYFCFSIINPIRYLGSAP